MRAARPGCRLVRKVRALARFSFLSRDGFIRSLLRDGRRDLRYRILTARARRNRAASRACFIAITGSSAKTTTTALLAHVLAGHGPAFCVVDKNTRFPVARGVARVKPTDRYAVFETGAAGPGSIKVLADVVQPDVAIVTMVGLEHYSSFRGREAVAEEKGGLVAAVRPGGFAVLNADDEHVMGMRARTKERVVTFGCDLAADYRIVSASHRFPGPLIVEFATGGGNETITSGLVGEQYGVTVAAVYATARELGVPTEVIRERIASFEPVSNRAEPYPTENGPTFLLDATKAPYESLPLIFDVVKKAEAPRKRIVLGHISDYTGTSSAKYRAAYRMAREAADEIMFIGPKSHRSGASVEDIEAGRFREMVTVQSIAEHVRATAQRGELILLKGSRNLHLERVALAFDHDVKCWVERCGKNASCFSCGLYGEPFEKHRGKRKRLLRKKRR